MAPHGARAAPPVSRLAAPLAHGGESRPINVSASMRVPAGRLDLAPPQGLPLYERPAAAAFVPQRTLGAALAANLPTLGGPSPGRIMSRPEVLVRNFKREGLPLAKLFQSENSLVHVGLNPKGKPGLWFVEKLH